MAQHVVPCLSTPELLRLASTCKVPVTSCPITGLALTRRSSRPVVLTATGWLAHAWVWVCDGQELRRCLRSLVLYLRCGVDFRPPALPLVLRLLPSFHSLRVLGREAGAAIRTTITHHRAAIAHGSAWFEARLQACLQR